MNVNSVSMVGTAKLPGAIAGSVLLHALLLLVAYIYIDDILATIDQPMDYSAPSSISIRFSKPQTMNQVTVEHHVAQYQSFIQAPVIPQNDIKPVSQKPALKKITKNHQSITKPVVPPQLQPQMIEQPQTKIVEAEPNPVEEPVEIVDNTPNLDVPQKTDQNQATIKNASFRGKRQAPKYPKRALMLGMEGEVTIKALVDREGDIKDIKLLESSGYRILDKAVMNIAWKWQFNPTYLNGKPVEQWVQAPYQFRIH